MGGSKVRLGRCFAALPCALLRHATKNRRDLGRFGDAGGNQ